MAKILLIDDEADMRALMSRILESDGHTVTTAESGRFVVNGLAQDDFASAYDIVVTDIVMPDVEGLETIRLLKRANPRTKIVAVSGGGRYAGPGKYLQLARNLGADATLAKPFSVAILLVTVNALLAPQHGDEDIPADTPEAQAAELCRSDCVSRDAPTIRRRFTSDASM